MLTSPPPPLPELFSRPKGNLLGESERLVTLLVTPATTCCSELRKLMLAGVPSALAPRPSLARSISRSSLSLTLAETVGREEHLALTPQPFQPALDRPSPSLARALLLPQAPQLPSASRPHQPTSCHFQVNMCPRA